MPALSILHLALGLLVFFLMLYRYWRTSAYQYLIMGALTLVFLVTLISGLRLSRVPSHLHSTVWMNIAVLIVGILAIPFFFGNALSTCLFFLVAIPLYVAVTGQLKKLPVVLFLILTASAVTILIDLTLASAPWRLVADGSRLWKITGLGLFCYLVGLGLITVCHYRRTGHARVLQVNVATQYTLVFTGISTLVVILVSGVLISQIRTTQINQVGKTFQTVAENFAKLVGSHLEQQTQKLQLLTEQVPIFKQGLLKSNAQYADRDSAHRSLLTKNRLWEGPDRDNTFIMNYLNNPIIRALSRFRGHNSFHSDLVLVDGYGGLVASLGRKPERIYFHDQNWWQITWNGGLGNIFIGDLMMDAHSRVPKLRIAIDIIDHTTNEVIGMLSSSYLLRTLLEDIQRFRPDAVDQISLVDATGRVIAGTAPEVVHHHIWPQLSTTTPKPLAANSGWMLGRDHLDQAALMGFSSLSTAYKVISDPLHRLGWHVVVSGTRSNVLSGVTRYTKIALLVGLVVMALGVLGSIAAARVITRPLENLTATATAMIDGDLENRARLTGPEELVVLADSFNRLTERLHQMIRNLKSQATQLDKAKRGAEAATQLKDQFLANMSHEIRTPLNAILGFADLLEASIEDKKRKRHAQTIKASGADLLHLINDILDLSKIEAGRMEIKKSPVNVRTLLDELQRIFAISAEEKGIKFEITVDAKLPKQLMMDRVRLRQVLFNLIGNAVKFTDTGQVHCVAGGSRAGKDKFWDLVIEVRDTGIGIDPKAYADIFETFKQHGQAQTTRQGTGLGLAISKSLMEMMGGRIEVGGRPEIGSVFTIYLPQVSPTDTPADSEAESAHPPVPLKVFFEPAAILVVDDLEVNRRLIIEDLRAYPLEISQAENGKAAVRLAIQKRFDLILMDIRMPDGDGYRALEQIRSHYPSEPIPVIATTAAGMKADIDRIQQAGFDDHLIRPFDQEALVRMLMRYLPCQVQEVPSKTRKTLTPDSIKADPPWRCPPQAEADLVATLKKQWEQVTQRQSIREIVAFANEVHRAGERHQIELLMRYGRELADYAEDFDILNLERLLKIFDVVLSHRVNSDPNPGQPEIGH